MKIGSLITKALGLADMLRDIPELSEEAEEKVFKLIGQLIQVVIDDMTS